jgi:hypothetical protein
MTAGRPSVRRMVPLLVAGVLLAALPLSTCGEAPGICETRPVPPPAVPLPRQKAASRAALALPLVRRAIAGHALSGVSIDVQANRQGTLIGVRTSIRLGQPAPVDAIWPWLLVDNTGAMHPPYQIVRRRARTPQLFGIDVTMLAPSYRLGAVSGWTTGPGGHVDTVAGARDTRPPQPHCS